MRMLSVVFVVSIVFGNLEFSFAKGKKTEQESNKIQMFEGKNLKIGIAYKSGAMCSLESKVGDKTHLWLNEPIQVSVLNEETRNVITPSVNRFDKSLGEIAVHNRYGVVEGKRKQKPVLTSVERWIATEKGLTLEMQYTGSGEQTGNEIIIDFPILSKDSYVFTPTERGLMSVDENPSFKPVVYGAVGYSTEWRYYVLPLVAVFDLKSDNALTIALPPNINIPHFQVEWSDMKTLRLRFGHRAMGNEKPVSLKLLFYAHKADYRSVIKAYSDDFPEYFKPVLPVSKYEGAFWYHHIHNHPDFEEMSRQDVRCIWTSFWFPFLGEYLPAETEWYPYTFTKSLGEKVFGEKMSDSKIKMFADTMKEHGIGVFAYFNLTEYGSAGGKNGDRKEVESKIQSVFANDLLKLENGKPVVTWDSARVMNPRRGSAYREHLMQQVKRHLNRLPELEGFMVDRLDWASPDPKENPAGCDYGHNDGLTMIGNRPVENMAIPISDALQEMCKMTHAAGKRIYINQFWRVELLRDADAYVHEFDYVRGLGYVSPYRPVSAWNSNNYSGKDLLQFEAQLKRRLQFALFPHMIAHEFKIAQQPQNAKAADMLEIFSPLFSLFHGKQQVLEPHCVAVTGSNDANLFINGDGHYVVPVTSRFRFLSRGSNTRDSIMVTLNVPDASELKWAHVYSTDTFPYKALITERGGSAFITLGRHISNSVIQIGKGSEPQLIIDNLAMLAELRKKFLTNNEPDKLAQLEKPQVSELKRALIRIKGLTVGEAGKVAAYSGGSKLGEVPLRNSGPLCAGYTNTSSDEYKPLSVDFDLPLIDNKLPHIAPELWLICGDEGTWFVPEQAELVAIKTDGKSLRLAEWNPNLKSGIKDIGIDGFSTSAIGSNIEVILQWCKPVETNL